MRIVEKSKIDRPADKVWPFIIRPEYFMKWNTKIIAMDAQGEFRVGQTFITHYRMNSKEIQCSSMATAIEEGRRLELRHSNCVGKGNNPELEVHEKITLQAENGHTIVLKEVVITNHDIPCILIPIIWFVTRFGKTTEPDLLKLMCESDD